MSLPGDGPPAPRLPPLLTQVEISKSYTTVEWREDLRRILRLAGAEGKPTVFLFSDTQIKDEAFVEDINNILNAGEVPNMFPNDEKSAVIEMVRPIAAKQGLKLETPLELWAFFTKRCREMLHVSLCFSPIGGAFRDRLRQYPALVNCCTINWFQVSLVVGPTHTAQTIPWWRNILSETT